MKALNAFSLLASLCFSYGEDACSSSGCDEATLSVSSASTTALSTEHGGSGALFDDLMFKLTPEAKAELQQQLLRPDVQEALAWAQTGTSVSDKQGNSITVVQEAFIFLLRFLSRMRLLPFTGDRSFHGMALWNARQGVQPRGEERLERTWMNMYFYEIADKVVGPACLEWDVNYIDNFPQCTEKFAIKYKASQMKREGNILYGDIYKLGEAGLKFNLIMLTQVLEHIEFPEKAVAAIFEATAPGGAVVYTGPHMSQFHGERDWTRWTKMKVRAVFRQAGFCVPDELMAAGGDFIFDAARALGMRRSVFNDEEIRQGYQRGYENIGDGAIGIFAVAYKPPHDRCPQQAPRSVLSWFGL
eukprot:gnl/TRDRNA2_/TRDRNA2_90545_c0_seq2.p1 gnl/TRDRNA2_/TRDRNA2_90545_c0~~gnl/TRDRNA2_/TRDRNA2_90545_c0_seq2.p1  ORF type:complete len:358 (+),score=38.31 gnl/TRDRNA2_/TRDRNA2_90545_c0_seq2:1-1074(+)